MYFYYKLLHWMLFIFLIKSIRNCDLVEKWISDHIYLKKMLKPHFQ